MEFFKNLFRIPKQLNSCIKTFTWNLKEKLITYYFGQNMVKIGPESTKAMPSQELRPIFQAKLQVSKLARTWKAIVPWTFFWQWLKFQLDQNREIYNQLFLPFLMSRVRIMCFSFSLNSLRFSLTKETDKKKNWAIFQNFKSLNDGTKKTHRKMQFRSCQFYQLRIEGFNVSFSHEKKSERIKTK